MPSSSASGFREGEGSPKGQWVAGGSGGGGAMVTSMESPSEEGNLRNSEEEGEYLGKGYHECTH